jgi:hypothetical protein
LPSWQPILTPQGVIIAFLIVGIPFIILGFVCRAASDAVTELRVQYDGPGRDPQALSCAVGSSFNGTKSCTLSMKVTADMAAPIYVYYELTNFYQNHRRYVKSRSDAQLAGTVYTDPSSSLLFDCDPLRARGGKVLHPCGLMANSYFNDTFNLTGNRGPIDETGIAWSTDKAAKFKPVDVTKHRGLVTYINDTYPGVSNVDNEHFIVWMRPAALPSFRKLYGRITTSLKSGDVITFDVKSNYPVESFGGTKALVVTTLSFLGGKNSFLGIAYLVVGFLCIALAFLFGLKHYVVGGRKLGDASFLLNSAQRR